MKNRGTATMGIVSGLKYAASVGVLTNAVIVLGLVRVIELPRGYQQPDSLGFDVCQEPVAQITLILPSIYQIPCRRLYRRVEVIAVDGREEVGRK
jgi:hypothetical protein